MALGLAVLRPVPDGAKAVHYAPDVRRAADQPTHGPEVRLKWDEASATQAIYLYTQIATTYSSDAMAFSDAVRHPVNRDHEAMQRSLRHRTLAICDGPHPPVITRPDVAARRTNGHDTHTHE